VIVDDNNDVCLVSRPNRDHGMRYATVDNQNSVDHHLDRTSFGCHHLKSILPGR
jgi:hypothetical protein